MSSSLMPSVVAAKSELRYSARTEVVISEEVRVNGVWDRLHWPSMVYSRRKSVSKLNGPCSAVQSRGCDDVSSTRRIPMDVRLMTALRVHPAILIFSTMRSRTMNSRIVARCRPKKDGFSPAVRSFDVDRPSAFTSFTPIATALKSMLPPNYLGTRVPSETHRTSGAVLADRRLPISCRRSTLPTMCARALPLHPARMYRRMRPH